MHDPRPAGLLSAWGQLAGLVAVCWLAAPALRALPPLGQILALLVAYAVCRRAGAWSGAGKRGNTMTYLNRDAILGADDAEFDEVDVPEWGGTVRLKSITGSQRDAFEASLREGKGKDADVNLRNVRAKLIVLCAIDEDGRRLFSADDLRRLGSKNAKPLDRLFDACKNMIGMSDDDVKTYTEDFGQTPDVDSNTD